MSAQDNYYKNDALAHATLTITTQRKAQTSVIKIAFAIIGILIAVGFGLIVLLVIGIETGPVAFLLGFFAATIPVPIYVILVLWIDRYESEPFWMLATAFFWGALVAHILRISFEYNWTLCSRHLIRKSDGRRDFCVGNLGPNC